MKLTLLLNLFLISFTYTFSQEKFILLDDEQRAMTLYFKDGRTFHIANKLYEAYTFQWWDAGPKTEDGFHNIRNVEYNKCLYLDARQNAVEVTTCGFSDIQLWKIEDGRLINRSNKMSVKLNEGGNMLTEKSEGTIINKVDLKPVKEAEIKIDSKMESLGERINTRFHEVMPVVSGDGQQIFFMRKELTEDKKVTANIYSSVKSTNTRWSLAHKLPEPLNNDNRNYVCSASMGGEKLLLGNEYHKDGSVSQGISETEYKNGAWTFPKPINIEGFENYSNKAEYNLSHDGRILLMAIENRESVGQRDLFVSFKNEDGSFGSMINLGNTVNTPFQEDAPFLSADRKALFFSSNGHPGYGRHDLFMTKRLDTTWTNWSEPVNLGKKINSKEWEAYFTVDGKAEYAYVVADNGVIKGRSDIYRVKLPTNFAQKAVFVLNVEVIDDATEEKVKSLLQVYENNSDELELERLAVDGTFKGYLEKMENHTLFVQAPGYNPLVAKIPFDENAEEQFMTVRLIKQSAGEHIMTFQNINFDFDKIVWTNAGKRELKMMASFMDNHSDITVELRGHTDNKGEDDYNQKLSENRAKAVYDFFIETGVSPSRIKYKGFGEKQPVASNDTEEGRAKNRRVEFVILKK